jgi:hypothetical protein
MGFQGRLGLLPPDAEILSDALAVSRQEGNFVFFNPGGPILRAAEGDAEQIRLAGVLLLDSDIGGGVKVGELAAVLGVHRSSLHRWRQAYEAESLEELREEKRGPKGAHKLRGAVLDRAQRDLDQGRTQAEAPRRGGAPRWGTRLDTSWDGSLVEGHPRTIPYSLPALPLPTNCKGHARLALQGKARGPSSTRRQTSATSLEWVQRYHPRDLPHSPAPCGGHSPQGRGPPHLLRGHNDCGGNAESTYASAALTISFASAWISLRCASPWKLSA